MCDFDELPIGCLLGGVYRAAGIDYLVFIHLCVVDSGEFISNDTLLETVGMHSLPEYLILITAMEPVLSNEKTSKFS